MGLEIVSRYCPSHSLHFPILWSLQARAYDLLEKPNLALKAYQESLSLTLKHHPKLIGDIAYMHTELGYYSYIWTIVQRLEKVWI